MQVIDIVSPVYAEEKGILSFHYHLTAALAPLDGKYQFRFIYVVDPAGDKTESVLEELAARDLRVEVIVMSRRFGQQLALVAGLDASQGNAVVMLDSDLQHPPELILDFVRAWEEGAEIVQGLRVDGKETAGWKRSTSAWFYKTFGTVSSVELKSGAADFRLMSRRVVDLFRNDITEHNPFLRGLVSWVGFNVRFIPFKPAVRLVGTTKYTISALIDFAINGVCSFSKAPLRLCIYMGLMIAALSLVGGAINVAAEFIFHVPGWGSLFAAVTFLGGVQLIFLGVIGEYVGLIFDEVKRRPRYIVSRHFGRERTTNVEAPSAEIVRLAGEARSDRT